MNGINVVQTIAIIVTIIAFIITQYFNWKSTNAISFNRMGDAYDKIVTYRLEHPEVLMIARRWENGDLEKLETNAEIAKYYSYGELCIGFCDICLYHLNSKLISKKDFDNYYSGLMNLVAKENQNYFEEIVKNPYCSRAFREWFARWNQKA